MRRRKALQSTGYLAGVALMGTDFIFSACQSSQEEAQDKAHVLFDPLLLEEVADVIIPDTPEVPGAKKAQIGEFMHLIIQDCYPQEEQIILKEGLEKLQQTAQEKLKRNFMDLPQGDKEKMLLQIAQDATNYEQNRKTEEVPHYFSLLKKLTAFAYFRSEVGATQALRYKQTPGRWDPCVPYKPGEKAWA